MAREYNSGVFGIIPSGREVWNLGDRARCYVAIRICEAASLEQIDISLVVIPWRSLDSYEQVEVGFDMDIIVLVSSR